MLIDALPAQFILESLPDYIWITDTEHCYIAGSEKSAQIIGFDSVEKMLGNNLKNMRCDAKHSATELCWQRDYVLQNKKTIEVLDIHPYADGQIHTHHAKRHPFYDTNGTILGVLVLARKINHQLFSKLLFTLIENDKQYHQKNAFFD